MQRRHETPVKRVSELTGRVSWLARYTNRAGKRVSAGTFRLEREAQAAIDAAYDREYAAPRRADTVGAYAATWTERHPRSPRSNYSYNERVSRVLDVRLEGLAFRDWRMGDVRRRQVNDLIHELLVKQGRAQKGAVGILRVLSAMWGDAIDDECAESNPFLRLRIKANDPRIRKAPRAIRVFTHEQMRAFAASAALVSTTPEMDHWRSVYAEAMVRVLCDCGLRLGELLALEAADFKGDGLEVRRTAWQGVVTPGTKNDHGKVGAGRDVPVPGGLAALLRALPRRIDTVLMFPTARGCLWWEAPFYREVWWPARVVAGIDPTPHEFRHGYVSALRAMGIDPADLAKASGHTVETATRHYTHALGRSADLIREGLG